MKMSKSFIDKDGFLYKKRPHTKTFTVPLERTVNQPIYFTDAELYAAKGSVLIFDLELYPNYFLIAFKCIKTNKIVNFELFPGKEVFNKHKLLWVMHNFCLVGFNSLKFDLPIIWLALQHADLDMLNEACEMIIAGNAQPRDIEQKFMFRQGEINHVDLIEVAPLSASLKAYGSRLHAQRLQDLPYSPNTRLTEEQAASVCLYCINDLDLTRLLFDELKPQLELRKQMSKQYDVDLRSKSDAQIAECFIISEIAKVLGRLPNRPKAKEGVTIQYNIPDFIEFKSVELNGILEKLRSAVFALDGYGSPVWPDGLGEKDKTKDGKFSYSLKTKIGDSIYRLGMGGLHSTEKNVSHIATDEIVLQDQDVTSYYPRIILNLGLYPEAMGPEFIPIYESMVTRRIEAKKAGDKVTADSLKIVVNSSFGKFGNKYSRLYSPHLLLQVTLTGQLSLLMLIEAIELAGISVVSGNTDGITTKCPKSRLEELDKISKEWETKTNFQLENGYYKAVYSRDINNYIAIKDDNSIKSKGCFSKPGLQKNAETLICYEALQNLLVNNIPIERTIRECKDIRRFTSARNVKGGAEKNGIYLGKVVRWIYSNKTKGDINYVLSGNKVPKTDNARPLMDLPNEFPEDIDYNWYVEETISMLYDIGYYKKKEQSTLF